MFQNVTIFKQTVHQGLQLQNLLTLIVVAYFPVQQISSVLNSTLQSVPHGTMQLMYCFLRLNFVEKHVFFDKQGLQKCCYNAVQVLTLVGAGVHTLMYVSNNRRNSDRRKLYINNGIVLRSTLLQLAFFQCFAFFAYKMMFFIFL